MATDGTNTRLDGCWDTVQAVVKDLPPDDGLPEVALVPGEFLGAVRDLGRYTVSRAKAQNSLTEKLLEADERLARLERERLESIAHLRTLATGLTDGISTLADRLAIVMVLGDNIELPGHKEAVRLRTDVLALTTYLDLLALPVSTSDHVTDSEVTPFTTPTQPASPEEEAATQKPLVKTRRLASKKRAQRGGPDTITSSVAGEQIAPGDASIDGHNIAVRATDSEEPDAGETPDDDIPEAPEAAADSSELDAAAALQEEQRLTFFTTVRESKTAMHPRTVRSWLLKNNTMNRVDKEQFTIEVTGQFCSLIGYPDSTSIALIRYIRSGGSTATAEELPIGLFQHIQLVGAIVDQEHEAATLRGEEANDIDILEGILMDRFFSPIAKNRKTVDEIIKMRQDELDTKTTRKQLMRESTPSLFWKLTKGLAEALIDQL